MTNHRVEEIALVAGALADTGRLRTLLALGSGELCVCQIVELLGLAPSTVSRHLNVLRQAGLVQSRKRGRWVYCRLAEDPSPAASEALRWATRSVSAAPEARRDRKRLEGILCLTPEALCRLRSAR